MSAGTIRLTGEHRESTLVGMQTKHAPTVILANGQFPSAAAPCEALRSAERIVCCDGAAAKLAAEGFEPDWVVGDLDSLDGAARSRYADRLVRVDEQETNDLSKAFRFCVSRGWLDVAILGATGLREDHTLGNLSLLVDFAREAAVALLTDTGFFTPVLASSRLPSMAGQQVSIFSFDPEVRVRSDGLVYPLEGVRFTRWWRAALNEACGDAFELTFEGGPLLVFQTYR